MAFSSAAASAVLAIPVSSTPDSILDDHDHVDNWTGGGGGGGVGLPSAAAVTPVEEEEFYIQVRKKLC